MNTKTVKIAAITLILALMFSVFAVASDTEKEPQPKTTYISSHTENIDKGLISTSVSAEVSCTSSVTSVKIKMELQKLSDGVYSTIETWSQTFTGRSGIMGESKTTNPFSTYRLKVTFTAYTSTTSETRTCYVYAD